MDREEILSFVRRAIADETGQPESAIQESQTFTSLGLDSLSSIVVLNKIEDHYKTELNPLHFWDHPTVGAFADFLVSHLSHA